MRPRNFETENYKQGSYSGWSRGGICLNYLPGHSSLEGGGWAFKERKACVGEERREGVRFVVSPARVSGVLRMLSSDTPVCVC